MEPYTSSLEHVLAELERIDLLIHAQVERARAAVPDQGELQGLYISEQELDALLAQPSGLPRWAAVPQRPEVEEALADLSRWIDERKEVSSVELRLEELARRFELTPFDVDALLVALAPEVDLRYERLFAWLQDDVTKRRPSFDLVLNLLCPTFEDKLAARSRLAGPLLRHRLIEAFDDPSRPQPPLLARYLRADPRVVAYLFGDDAVDALLVALAPEVDLRYERLFAYLQDDVTKRRPSFDLVLNLLCPTFEAKLAARPRLTGPLLRHRLIEAFDDPSRPQPPMLARYLRADARVAAYLFGDDAIDARLAPFTRRVEPAARLEDLVQEPALKERLLALADQEGNRVLYLQGPSGVGKESTAEALCLEMDLLLVTLDLERLLAAPEETFETVVELAAREAVLQGAALFCSGFDLLLADDKAGRRGRFLALLEDRGGLTFLAGEAGWEPSDALHGAAFTRVEIPVPGHEERLELWRRALPEAGEMDLDAIAAKFRFTGGRIRDCAATARSLARARDPQEAPLTEADLYAACRLQSSQKLATLAQKIVPRYRWNDIVLPAARMEQLREICNMLRFRSRVYEEWGFGGKLAMGKGLNVLFSGPSGTGKTMAAEILASDLGLDLYKIDLSSVISKYIGETEKNLSRIFDEGRASNAILFFDEADAVFGKRTEVKDAHDRYANIEVSYLLQRMEEYEGMVILASNLRKNMDEAFVRRLHFTVEFPFPVESDRRRIWDGLWPDALPRGADLDFEFMARRFELPGGNIRNIGLASAFLAAADGGVVTMAHLIRATQREYQKMGKVMLSGEFGEYESLTMG